MLASVAVERAYREAAIKGLNAPPLTAGEQTEGLDRLNGFLLSLFGGEIGEVLSDWQVPQQQRSAPFASNNISLGFPGQVNNFDQPGPAMTGSHDISSYPPANVRLLARVRAVTTIFFPESPSDGARMSYVDTGNMSQVRLDGNGRRINGANQVFVDPGSEPVDYFYRADRGEWIVLAPLALTDPSPLPMEFDELLVTATAIRLTALDEIQPTAATVSTFSRLLRKAQRRYKQHVITSYGGQDMPNTQQAYESDVPW